jgi:hypothetical protein
MSLAYLLDRDGVYDAMLDLRKNWGLDKELIAPDKFSEWMAGYHPELVFTKEAVQSYEEFVDRWEVEKARGQIMTPEQQIEERKVAYLNKIDFEIELLMKKFGINPKYKNLISKAVICGVVEDGDLPKREGNFEYDFLLDSNKLKSIVERVFRGSTKSIKEELDRDRDWFYKFEKSKREGKTYEDSIDALVIESGETNEKIEQQLKRYRRFIRN